MKLPSFRTTIHLLLLGLIFGGCASYQLPSTAQNTTTQGSPGQAATITIGNVISGAVASVVNVGTPQNAVLNFVLPQGATGATGAALKAAFLSRRLYLRRLDRPAAKNNVKAAGRCNAIQLHALGVDRSTLPAGSSGSPAEHPDRIRTGAGLESGC